MKPLSLFRPRLSVLVRADAVRAAAKMTRYRALPTTTARRYRAPFGHGMVPKGEETSSAASRSARNPGRRLGKMRGVRAHEHSRENAAQIHRVPELRLSLADSRPRGLVGA